MDRFDERRLAAAIALEQRWSETTQALCWAEHDGRVDDVMRLRHEAEALRAQASAAAIRALDGR